MRFVSEYYFHNSHFPGSPFLTTPLILYPLLLSCPVSSDGPYSARSQLGQIGVLFGLVWLSPFSVAASSLLARGSHPNQELTSTSGDLQKPETHLSSYWMGSQQLSPTELWTWMGHQRTQPAMPLCPKEAGLG